MVLLLISLALLQKLCKVLHVDEAADLVVEKDVKDFDCHDLFWPLAAPLDLVFRLDSVLPRALHISLIFIIVFFVMTSSVKSKVFTILPPSLLINDDVLQAEFEDGFFLFR